VENIKRNPAGQKTWLWLPVLVVLIASPTTQLLRQLIAENAIDQILSYFFIIKLKKTNPLRRVFVYQNQ